MGKISDYVKTAEGKQVGIQRKLGKLSSPSHHWHRPIQPAKDTARPINLPHFHCYRPSAAKDNRRWGNRMEEWLRTVDGGCWVPMGGSSVEGRNKSAE